jgi:hypothetical protein
MSNKKNILEIDEIKTKKEPKFTKEQLIKSKMYRHQIDVLKVVLEENKTYSISETDKLINDFLKRKVKN